MPAHLPARRTTPGVTTTPGGRPALNARRIDPPDQANFGHPQQTARPPSIEKLVEVRHHRFHWAVHLLHEQLVAVEREDTDVRNPDLVTLLLARHPIGQDRQD